MAIFYFIFCIITAQYFRVLLLAACQMAICMWQSNMAICQICQLSAAMVISQPRDKKASWRSVCQLTRFRSVSKSGKMAICVNVARWRSVYFVSRWCTVCNMARWRSVCYVARWWTVFYVEDGSLSAMWQDVWTVFYVGKMAICLLRGKMEICLLRGKMAICLLNYVAR